MNRGQNSSNRSRGASRGRGRGRGKGRGSNIHEQDPVVQNWPEVGTSDSVTRNETRHRGGRGRPSSNSKSGNSTPRGRGRGNDRASPRGRPTQRARGFGRGNPKANRDAPLSALLYESRPLLKPIVFVRSVHTQTLFEQVEDILQATVKDVGEEEECHVPTADRITRVFSGGTIPRPEPSQSEDETSSEKLEEIDFEDMDTFREMIDSLALSSSPQSPSAVPAIEQIPTGVYTKPETGTNSTIAQSQPVINDDSSKSPFAEEKTIVSPIEDFVVGDNSAAISDSITITPKDTPDTPIYFIDVNPTSVVESHQASEAVTYANHEEVVPLGLGDVNEDNGEDIIVYVAPYPRSHKAADSHQSSQVPSQYSPPLGTPSTLPVIQNGNTFPILELDHSNTAQPSIPPFPLFESVSFSFANSPKPKKQPRCRPVFNSGAMAKTTVKAQRKGAASLRKRHARQAMFGSFGAIVSEAQLRAEGPERDPRRDERRRGDSDVDWGDDSDKDIEETGAAQDVGAMDIDPDLELGIDQMKSFVNGMGHGETHFVTMDDIADAEKMRQEDEDEEDGEDEERGSSADEQINLAVHKEETIMIAEPGDIGVESSEDEEDEEVDSSSDEGISPRAGFQARLERLRRNAQGKRKAAGNTVQVDFDSSDVDDVAFATQADKTEDFIARVQAMIEEEDDIVHGHDRKARKKLFRAIQNGNFDLDDFDGERYPAGHKQHQQLPVHLQKRLEKNRSKKAKKRRSRRQALLEQAADPFVVKKGGKKSRKLIRAAARQEPSAPIPNRVFSIATLVEQVQRFVDDLGGRSSMALPPMARYQRKQVHEIALAFNLKSKSKGQGAGRYTTLWKTTRTGLDKDEKKIARYMGGPDKLLGPIGKGRIRNPKPKDGEEVGKAAPKINQSNIGFRMLEAMGWSEGDRIGISGGLQDPLTAVIKNTKLGLGANR